MVRSLKSLALGWVCALVIAAATGSANAADYIAWATLSSGGTPMVVVGYGQTEADACACVQRISGVGTCSTVQVPYTVPACPHENPAMPGGGSVTVEYKVEFKAANNPFGTTFNVKMPKDTESSHYNSEVLVPLTLRLVAIDIAKKQSWGEVTGFSLEEVVSLSANTSAPGSINPTP